MRPYLNTMMFEATKKEWSELYILLRLLADGKVSKGTSKGAADPAQPLVINQIDRQEQNGVRTYYPHESMVAIDPPRGPEPSHMTFEEEEAAIREIPNAVVAHIADLVLELLHSGTEGLIASTKEIEDFLDEIALYDLAALSKDGYPMSVSLSDTEESLTTCKLWSRLDTANPLLDGGRTANLKMEQTGVKFSSPTVQKINALETQNTVGDRMLMIERLGGVLKYDEPADKVFRANLAMIDLHLGRLLTEMLRLMHLEGITRISDLTQRIKVTNPLKVKAELIEKHGYYEYKMKQLLLAAALGMRPAKIFTGEACAPEGIIVLNTDGSLLYYKVANRNLLAEFLYNNTRLEKGAFEKDKYGVLERENNAYYFKLNLKIGFTKR